jgi:hypothetical protein
MVKIIVILAALYAVGLQYPDFAKSAKQAVRLEMSHFLPTPR